jgi:hypothetical protein
MTRGHLSYKATYSWMTEMLRFPFYLTRDEGTLTSQVMTSLSG